MKYGEIAMEGTLFISSIFLFYNALQIPRGIAREIGPALWPAILLSGIAILSLILIVKAFRGGIKKEKVTQKKSERKRVFFLAVILTFVYVYLLKFAGFIVPTMILLGSHMYLMGYRKKSLILIVPVIFVASILFFFGIIMKVTFPRGIGLLREMSYLFY